MGFGPAQGGSGGTTLSGITSVPPGTIQWNTGLGAITHLTGPSDQNLQIKSPTAAAAASAKAIKLQTGVGDNGSGGDGGYLQLGGGASTGAGGTFDMAAGDARGSGGARNGGDLNFAGGSGALIGGYGNGGSGAQIVLQGGQGAADGAFTLTSKNLTVADTGQVTWPTGLGAITHILGPTDQPFTIASYVNSGTGDAQDLQIISTDAPVGGSAAGWVILAPGASVGNNVNAARTSVRSGSSTGTGTGIIEFKTASAGGAGSGVNAPTTKMTLSGAGLLTITPDAGNTALTLAGGTTTTSAPPLSATQTWNAGGVTFVGASLAFTETADAAASRLLQIRGGTAGTSDRFVFYKNGVPFFSDNGGVQNAFYTNSTSTLLATYDAQLPWRMFLSNATPGMIVQLGSSKGTTASPTALADDDLIGGFEFSAWLGSSSLFNTAARIRGYVDGTPSDGSSGPGRLEFDTTPSGSTSPSRRAAVVAAGHFQMSQGLCVGWASSTTDPSGALTATLSRNADGVIQFGTTAANASGSWLATSGTLSTGLTAPLVQAAAGATAIVVAGGDGSSSAGGLNTTRGGAGNGADKNGGGLTLSPGIPTGTGAGLVKAQTGWLTTSNSTPQTEYDRLVITSKTFTCSTTSGTANTYLVLSNAVSNSGVGCAVDYVLEVGDGANHWSTISGVAYVAASNRNGTVTATCTTAGTSNQAISDTTTFTALAATTTVTVSTTNVNIRLTPSWSAGTPTVVRVTYQARVSGQGNLTPQ